MIDDPRSPIVSALLETEHYIFDAPRDHDEVTRKYEKETDYDNPMDMDKLERDMKKMDLLEKDVVAIELALEAIEEKMYDEIYASFIDEDKKTPAAEFEDKQ